jgi:NAD(P)-dependent dehydrogenase (short-subunit alcohol dehydrogenase family)
MPCGKEIEVKSILKVMIVGGIAGAAALLLTRRRKAYNLSGKTVLITGGSRGLGLAMAREFASKGSRVAICARDSAEIERALGDNDLLRSGAIGRTCDVTDLEDVRAMIKDLRDRLGHIDILVNNAGVIQVGPSDVMSISDYREAMDTHFWGAVYTTAEVLSEMRERGDGRIVNIASIGGKIAVPHLLPYSASKFALVGFSEGLHSEIAKDGVIVTTVCPGLMRTGSPRNAIFKGKNRLEYAWFSIMDSLPFFSINAARAARQIVTACKNGRAEIVLTIQANIAARIAGLVPSVTAAALVAMNGLLPNSGGIRTRATGAESESDWSPSLLTIANERAAHRYNEI